MQSKGIIKWLALLLGVASIFQLSFTFVTRGVESDADDYAKQQATLMVDEMKALSAESTEELTAVNINKAYQDAYNAAYDQFIEQKWDEVVYNLGVVEYTYGECKEKELNLGLDLRGGMNVMLEIKAQDVIRGYAGEIGEVQKATVYELLEERLAATNINDTPEDVVEDFMAVCSAEDLKAIFKSEDAAAISSEITSRVNSAVDATYEVLQTRIDMLGVVQPNIQKISNSNRIMVELPGVKEPERVTRMLASTAELQFWSVCSGRDSNTIYDKFVSEQFNSAVREFLSKQKDMSDAQIDILFSEGGWLMPTGGDGVVAIAAKNNMALISECLASPAIRGMFPADVKFCWANKSINGKSRGDFYLYALKGEGGMAKPLMIGSGITADVSTNPINGGVEVTMAMERAEADAWADITRRKAATKSPVAIVLDDYVYSAPTVNVAIEDGRSSIEGGFTVQEAEELAGVLNAGKAPAKATIVHTEVVGPSLGEKSIQSGMISFLIAFILVLLYMAFFYKTAGWIANVALVCNVLLLMGVLVSFGAVLTLPGIAGIVLTMGMAVDANVIIFERVKEELRAGKGLSLAIKDGFKNAYSAIIDGNITTIITGIVLFFLGTGPIKGFATTLVIGIITSLFCSIFITRVLLESRAQKRGTVAFSRKFTENFLRNVKFSFVNKRKYSYILSGILIVASVISLFTMKLNLGIEFTGGSDYVIKFDNSVDIEKVRENIALQFVDTEDAANASFEVKRYGDGDKVRITTQFVPSAAMVAEFDEAVKSGSIDIGIVASDGEQLVVDDELVLKYMIYEALADMYASPIGYGEFAEDNERGIESYNQVDGSISNEMTRDSLIAVVIALFAIGIYIVIRFRRLAWAVGATLALAHNAFLVVGIFSMLYAIMPFNLEVNQAFIAAILTIIGYSINDTVVIFDRIREYIGLYPKRDLRTNIDNAICATLSRTINTSGTTLVTLLSIFILGGETIRGFVFALILGVIIGTYSSIFIATPIAYDIQRRKANKEAKKAEKAAELPSAE